MCFSQIRLNFWCDFNRENDHTTKMIIQTLELFTGRHLQDSSMANLSLILSNLINSAKLWGKIFSPAVEMQLAASCTCLGREHRDRDYNRGITRSHETVILHAGTGNPITGNLPAQPRRLISCRIAAEWGQKTSQWGPREDLGDRMPFIIRGRPLRGKSPGPSSV